MRSSCHRTLFAGAASAGLVERLRDSDGRSPTGDRCVLPGAPAGGVTGGEVVDGRRDVLPAGCGGAVTCCRPGGIRMAMPGGDVVRGAGCVESRRVSTGAGVRDEDRSSEFRRTGGGTTSGGVVTDAPGG